MRMGLLTPDDCSVIAPLVSGVAGLSESSSSKADPWTFDVKTAARFSYCIQYMKQ